MEGIQLAYTYQLVEYGSVHGKVSTKIIKTCPVLINFEDLNKGCTSSFWLILCVAGSKVLAQP